MLACLRYIVTVYFVLLKVKKKKRSPEQKKKIFVTLISKTGKQQFDVVCDVDVDCTM